jgi:hypothetical protein
MPTSPNGPIPPDKFSFDGAQYSLKGKRVWALISFLWVPRQAFIESLASPVWDDPSHDISIIALGSIRREANRFFRENGIPLIVRIKGETVFLRDLPVIEET